MNPLQQAYENCPLCQGKTEAFAKIDCTRYANWHDKLPPTLVWMRCSLCQHVHTSHFWTPAGLNEVFRKAHSMQLAGASSSQDVKRAQWAPTIEKTIKLLGGYPATMASPSPPVWLDVGCGDGALIMTANDFGFSTIGLDARTEAISRISALGFNGHVGNFMQTPFNCKVDILSMMDVLEHLPYPREALNKAAEVIRPGGILIISLPDINCSSWRVMDSENSNLYWIEIEHHHNFSRQRLISLLSEYPFELSDFSIPFRYKAQMEIYAKRKH